MGEGTAVALAALVALFGQSLFIFLESRKRRVDATDMMRAAARLVRDDISGSMEAVHQTLQRGTWWSAELDLEQTATIDDRRLLAARADAETLRRSFGSLRRFRQLQTVRRARIDAGTADRPLDRDDLVETVAVFLDLAVARRRLSQYTDYGTAPFARPVALPPDLLAAGLAAAAIPSAEGLYVPLTPAPGP